MIGVFVTSFASELSAPVMARHLDSLPEEMRKSINRYKRWQDRHRALLARLLLRAGLQSLGFPADVLGSIRLDAYGRPFLGGEVDFNISHSGNCILCALACGQRVGIDVEAVRRIDLSDFRSAFSPEEWSAINGADDPHAAFFSLWTRKESAGKADGRGLSIPLEQIVLDNTTARIGSTVWHLAPLRIHPAYIGHLATDGRIDFELTEINCYEEKAFCLPGQNTPLLYYEYLSILEKS
jgi:4'-phosphopantetheinyl transferase